MIRYPLRLLPVLLVVGCSTAGEKGDDDALTTDAPVTAGDDDDDALGEDLNALEFYQAWYELACDAAVDCDASVKVIDAYCNTDPAEFSGFSTTSTVTDCDFNRELAEECLNATIQCDGDELDFANVCEAVFSCD